MWAWYTAIWYASLLPDEPPAWFTMEDLPHRCESPISCHEKNVIFSTSQTLMSWQPLGMLSKLENRPSAHRLKSQRFGRDILFPRPCRSGNMRQQHVTKRGHYVSPTQKYRSGVTLQPVNSTKVRHQFWLRKPIAWSSHILGHTGHLFPLTHVAQKDYMQYGFWLCRGKCLTFFPQPIQAWERYLGINLGKRRTVLTDGVNSRCENGGVNSTHGFSRLLPQHRKRTATTRDKPSKPR